MSEVRLDGAYQASPLTLAGWCPPSQDTTSTTQPAPALAILCSARGGVALLELSIWVGEQEGPSVVAQFGLRSHGVGIYGGAWSASSGSGGRKQAPMRKSLATTA
jgi:hypothetical protein